MIGLSLAADADLSVIQGEPALSAILILSCLGLALLGTAEWILGRYVLGSSWDRLLVKDRVRQSRILLGMLLAIAIATLLVAKGDLFFPIPLHTM